MLTNILRPPCALAWLGLFLCLTFSMNAWGQEPDATKGDAPATTEAKPMEPAAADKAADAPMEPAAAAPVPLDVQIGNLRVAVDTMWVMITGFLVFFMNLGFGCVEAGFCRVKNCVNILSKNFVVFAVSTLGFWLVGFGLMFGTGNDFIGTQGIFALFGADNSPATGTAYVGDYGAISWTGVPLSAKFFFQLVFAGTAATIVSGAVAERIKYHSFILFSLFISIFIYPVVGHWIWGGGFLQAKYGFWDFAGCTQVHSIGGWCALTGILFLGARRGRYGKDGSVRALPGHSMMAAFIGCLVLWFGWFGFNPGSTMMADATPIANIALTTNISAALATLTATATAWILLGKPDIGMTLNGCLAGLVGITASCAYVSPMSAAIIGAIAGVIVVFSVGMFDKFKIDDPVGATSVHLVCGVFGTLCVGIFAEPAYVNLVVLDEKLQFKGLLFGGGFTQLTAQLTGVLATAVYVVIASSICWAIIKATIGLRVSEAEEIEGLDHGEHGNVAYHGFVTSPNIE